MIKDVKEHIVIQACLEDMGNSSTQPRQCIPSQAHRERYESVQQKRCVLLDASTGVDSREMNLGLT